jgi:hypothetical protein
VSVRVRCDSLRVGEAVAIVSVAASALVGVGGLASASWGASRERGWQSREERATELRKLLEDGAAHALELAWTIASARHKIQKGEPDPHLKEELRSLGKQAAHARVPIGVRRGTLAPEYVALGEWISSLSRLIGMVGAAQQDGFDAERLAAFKTEWDKGAAAEVRYMKATAELLAS